VISFIYTGPFRMWLCAWDAGTSSVTHGLRNGAGLVHC